MKKTVLFLCMVLILASCSNSSHPQIEEPRSTDPISENRAGYGTGGARIEQVYPSFNYVADPYGESPIIELSAHSESFERDGVEANLYYCKISGLKGGLSEKYTNLMSDFQDRLAEEVLASSIYDELLSGSEAQGNKKMLTINTLPNIYSHYLSFQTYVYIGIENSDDYTLNKWKYQNYYETYDLLTGEKLSLSDLFFDDVQYGLLLTSEIKKQINSIYYMEDDLLRPIPDVIDEKYYSFSLQSFSLFDGSSSPLLTLHFGENNPYFYYSASFNIPLERIYKDLAILDGDMRDILEDSALAAPRFTDRIDTIKIGYKDLSLPYEFYETTGLELSLDDKNIQDAVNLKLSLLEDELISMPQLSTFMQNLSDSSENYYYGYFSPYEFHLFDNFFTVLLSLNSGAEDSFYQSFGAVTIDLRTSNVLTPRDFIRADALGALSEEELSLLDCENIFVSQNGEITCYAPHGVILKQTDIYSLSDYFSTYSSDLFDFEKYEFLG